MTLFICIINIHVHDSRCTQYKLVDIYQNVILVLGKDFQKLYIFILLYLSCTTIMLNAFGQVINTVQSHHYNYFNLIHCSCRYEFCIAALTSAGEGPCSSLQTADTIDVTITEPSEGEVYEQIWFIVVMVVIVVIIIAVIFGLTLLLIKLFSYKAKSTYHSESTVM